MSINNSYNDLNVSLRLSVKLVGTVVLNIIGSLTKIALKLYISFRLCFGSQLSTDVEYLWVSVGRVCVCECANVCVAS